MLRVVLIDDAGDVRAAIAELIRHAGHEIVGEAENGATGVQEVLAHRPDLVIIDWRMPGMDGLEATRRIRAAYPSAAIVAFCSDNTPELREAFLTAGTDAFVDKRNVNELIVAARAIAERRTNTD